jgi:hypothetical protein
VASAATRSLSWQRIGVLLLPAGLALQFAASWVPDLVERAFSRSLYPRFGGALGCLTATLPFSLAEVLVASAIAWLGWSGARSLRRLLRREAQPRATLVRAWTIAGAAYGFFLLVWGLNYQRQPFAVSAGWNAAPPRTEELAALAEELVDETDRLRDGLAEDEAGVVRLPDARIATLARVDEGFAEAARLHPFLSGGRVIRCARPKPVLASTILSWLGISGLYFPFTGEPNVNTTLPDPELPFAAAHEVAHLRGFAREDEASFVGVLACRLHPDQTFRYSGTFVASLHALAALRMADRSAAKRIAATRSAAVTRDVEALRAWSARYRGPAQKLAEGVNDAYLRSQGQRDGVRSYGRLVDLLVAERRAR